VFSVQTELHAAFSAQFRSKTSSISLLNTEH
jgi:hypothetical protein